MLRHISSYTHAVATTPAEQLGALVARLPQLQRPSLVYGQVGFRITLFEACSAFTHVTACVLAKSPKATLYTGGFSGFVASTTAPIATGWSDPCRVGFAPTEDVRLSTAHREQCCYKKCHALNARVSFCNHPPMTLARPTSCRLNPMLS